tara:strand:- start:7 stop:921 length:915 start_codon:yes stop_codon:yes gene_type:complete
MNDKLSVFILSLFLGSSLGLAAQPYLPLLKEANEWHLTNCNSGCNTDVYIATDDTLIQGKSYSILDGYHYISRSFLLREDTANRKVYFLFVRNGKPDPEILLYDFSLSVGDSMAFYNPISPFPSDAGYFSLDSIKSKNLNDGSISRFFYWSANDSIKAGVTRAVWVEGSGSQSLINAPGGFPDVNQAGKLSCHFKSGVLSYFDLDSINECLESYNLSSNPIEIPSLKFNVYPLPFQSKLHIEGSKNISKIQIYNLNGSLLSEFSYPNLSKVELNFANFQPGFFVLKITNSDGEVKFLKILKNKT